MLVRNGNRLETTALCYIYCVLKFVTGLARLLFSQVLRILLKVITDLVEMRDKRCDESKENKCA